VRTLAVLAAGVVGVAAAQGCGDETLAPTAADAPAATPHDWTDCQATRRRSSARRRSPSRAAHERQAEVNAYEDAIAALDARRPRAPSPPG